MGIGATEFSKDSGRSEVQLATEAIRAALDDAGIEPSEVDGMSVFTMENNPEIQVQRNLGFGSLRHFSRVHYGGGAACATTTMAAMAVATGVADVVVEEGWHLPWSREMIDPDVQDMMRANGIQV